MGWKTTEESKLIKVVLKLGNLGGTVQNTHWTPRKFILFCGSFLFVIPAKAGKSPFSSMSLEMSTLVTFAKTKGFVYPGSEIYGGLANSWDYGPLGSLLKENIKNLWIKNFVQKRKDMTLLDAAILMNPQVWIASGHVGGFSDPLIDNTDSNVRYRADKMIEDAKDINPDGLEVFAFRKKTIEKLSNERGISWTFEDAKEFPIYKDYFS